MKLLFRARHQYWRAAAFASMLEQGTVRDAASADDDLRPCVVPPDLRVSNAGELSDMIDAVGREIETRAETLAEYLASTPLMRLVELEANGPTEADVVAAAQCVIDFYDAHLLLANRVRATDAPRRYRKVVDSISRLVDCNLDGVDRFVTEYSRLVRALPSMERNTLRENVSCVAPIVVEHDTQSVARLRRKLRILGWMDRFWPR